MNKSLSTKSFHCIFENWEKKPKEASKVPSFILVSPSTLIQYMIIYYKIARKRNFRRDFAPSWIVVENEYFSIEQTNVINLEFLSELISEIKLKWQLQTFNHGHFLHNLHLIAFELTIVLHLNHFRFIYSHFSLSPKPIKRFS